MLNVEYVGLACFRLWEDGGPVVVLDPYTPDSIGMPERTVDGDVIVASSLTDDAHFCRELVAGEPQVINALDAAEGAALEVAGSPLVALGVTEDPERIDAPRDCAMYGFRIGGLDVVHMGDAGYVPDDAELEVFAGRCDVLMVLAGVLFTPPLPEIDRIIDRLRPKWILPMHYGLPPIIYAFRPVDDIIGHRATDVVVLPRATTVRLPLPGFDDAERVLIAPQAAGLAA